MSAPIPPALIAVAGDAETLAAIAAVASRFFRVLKTTEPARAVQWIQTEPRLAVILIEHRPGHSSALSLLESLRKTRPNVRRLLLTDLSDLPAIIEGIHSGAIHAFIQKPIK